MSLHYFLISYNNERVTMIILISEGHIQTADKSNKMRRTRVRRNKRNASLRLKRLLSQEKERGSSDIKQRLKALQNLQLEAIALVNFLLIFLVLTIYTEKFKFQ